MTMMSIVMNDAMVMVVQEDEVVGATRVPVRNIGQVRHFLFYSGSSCSHLTYWFMCVVDTTGALVPIDPKHQR